MVCSVSIIMPCYNAIACLPTSVASVYSQTFTDWELIAVDDGSSDGTLSWLQAQKEPRLIVHTQPNQGVSAARNAGLDLAQGKYVAFLDADDSWDPTFLKRMASALESRPDAVLAYCGWRNLGLPGRRSEPFIPPDYENQQKREILFAGCRWPIHAVLTKRAAIATAGGFDTSLKNAEDYALWLEIAAEDPIVRVSEVLAFYHFHSNAQASGQLTRAALHFLLAQKQYLARHPDFAAQLGRSRIRTLLYGNLLESGYEHYWKRDLPSARIIFRNVMRVGYGRPRDWLHMLPALLPLPLHRLLIQAIDKVTSKHIPEHEKRI